MKDANAASDLLGRTLKSGWKVLEKIEKESYGTGAFFSVCYKVEKDGNICFLKAFDFAKFFQVEQGKLVVDIMADMINAFKYEKELSEYCKGHHVTKVIFVKDFGEENIENYTIPTVPYLIFELADGDVRKFLHFSENLDVVWRMKSLHSIAVGLKQLHYIEVSHQDLKPSNILIVKGDTRIGDIGRSLCKNMPSPWDRREFSGDYNYAPPEIMYGYYERDWMKRVFATDCYLLGSMVVFYFLGISMSALLRKFIPDMFSWDKWRGTFEELEPYLLDAFDNALLEFASNIKDEYLKNELKWVVEHLCHPIPERRGHPKNINSIGSSFNLERFVSKFDMLGLRYYRKVI